MQDVSHDTRTLSASNTFFIFFFAVSLIYFFYLFHRWLISINKFHCIYQLPPWILSSTTTQYKTKRDAEQQQTACPKLAQHAMSTYRSSDSVVRFPASSFYIRNTCLFWGCEWTHGRAWLPALRWFNCSLTLEYSEHLLLLVFSGFFLYYRSCSGDKFSSVNVYHWFYYLPRYRPRPTVSRRSAIIADPELVYRALYDLRNHPPQ